MTILEAQRARWERYRSELRLTHAAGEEFGRGGLGRLVRDLDLRFVVLPADPWADVVSLDKELLDWLKQPRPAPFRNEPFDWGGQTRLTANAAERYSSHEEGWDRYIAVHRHGGIEIARNSAAAEATNRDRPRVFYLRYIVAAVWCAIDLHEGLLKQHKVEGPFEVVLALRGTGGSVLGHLAEGWRDSSDITHRPPRCVDDDLFIRLDRESLIPTKDTAMELANRLGAAWGTTDQRHLAARGDYEGEFDPRGVI